MNVTLDGQELFDGLELQITAESVKRDSKETTVAGLNGVLSIDMGSRTRTIRQAGTLRAQSLEQLRQRVNSISAYIDGDVHKLATDKGETFENLRMDALKMSNERAGGNGMLIDYEIVYTQLKAQ